MPSTLIGRCPPGWPGAQGLPRRGLPLPLHPAAPSAGHLQMSAEANRVPATILAVTQAGLASGSFGWGGKSLEMRVDCEGETQSPAFPSRSFRPFSPTFQGPPRRMLWKATLLAAILALSHLP